jgi:hypothetical protein
MGSLLLSNKVRPPATDFLFSLKNVYYAACISAVSSLIIFNTRFIPLSSPYLRTYSRISSFLRDSPKQDENKHLLTVNDSRSRFSYSVSNFKHLSPGCSSLNLVEHVFLNMLVFEFFLHLLTVLLLQRAVFQLFPVFVIAIVPLLLTLTFHFHAFEVTATGLLLVVIRWVVEVVHATASTLALSLCHIY